MNNLNNQIYRANSALTKYHAAIEVYSVDHGIIPNNIHDLWTQGKVYIDKKYIQDPWGNPYQYKVINNGESYTLYSLGPDEKDGTGDEIRLPDDPSPAPPNSSP